MKPTNGVRMLQAIAPSGLQTPPSRSTKNAQALHNFLFWPTQVRSLLDAHLIIVLIRPSFAKKGEKGGVRVARAAGVGAAVQK